METLEAGDRLPMSWDEYRALNDGRRGEYYDGAFVVSPSASQRHQIICANLQMMIRPVLPNTVRVLSDWGWRPQPGTEFIPDVIVFDRTDETHLTGLPNLAVEVLSDDRGRDLLRKFHLYAQAGLPRYWVIDPEGPIVVAYGLAEDNTYHEIGRVEGNQETTLDIGPATLTLRPTSLLT